MTHPGPTTSLIAAASHSCLYGRAAADAELDERCHQSKTCVEGTKKTATLGGKGGPEPGLEAGEGATTLNQHLWSPLAARVTAFRLISLITSTE